MSPPAATKPKKATRPKTRPYAFTQRIADEVIARTRKGEPLVWICDDQHMPYADVVQGWLDHDDHKDFALAFARVTDVGRDKIAADMLIIADTPLLGLETEKVRYAELIGEGKDAKTIVTKTITRAQRRDMIAHRTLMINTRMRLLAAWDRRRYGGAAGARDAGGGDGGDDGSPTAIVVKGGLPADDDE